MVSEALITRCIRKEPKAQYELYRALYPVMRSICARYERNQQDACARMNQAFLKILDNIDRRKEGVPFEPWARRITINTVIDEHRRNTERKANEDLDALPAGSSSTEVNDYLAQMEAEAFAELLTQVPQGSRNVFNLFAIDGYAHAEIAEMLGISEGTSKWHVANARNILQQAIARMTMTPIPQTASR